MPDNVCLYFKQLYSIYTLVTENSKFSIFLFPIESIVIRTPAGRGDAKRFK